MARYIDADELTDEIKSLKISLSGKDIFSDRAKDSVMRIIDEQPTADVEEVVRCKDCKNFTKKSEEFLINDIFGICEKSRTGFFDDGEEVYGYDFCSYGERRDTE